MTVEKKKILPPYVMLCLVAIVMSFAIAGVYTLTKDTIEQAALEAQAAARASVMEDAAYMTELAPEDGAPVDYCYEAYDAAGGVIGYVSQVTVIGFGGEIEVTVGMDTAGAVTGVSVGGANFSETSGLGANTRKAEFTDQFKGMSGMLVLKQDIDSVTGASISSGAVVSGVNRALDYMRGFLTDTLPAADTEPLELTAEQLSVVLPGASEAVWMGAASGIDGWWRADNGYIVRATGFGEGPIVVTVGFTNDGVVAGIVIGDENFMETEGRGDGVLKEEYWSQFIGVSGAQTYGEGVDAVSGATVTSDATLSAINAALRFDPSAPASAAADETGGGQAAAARASVEPDPNPPVPTPDAVTEASIVEEEPAPTPAPTPDAVTEASIVEEEPAPTPEPTPDAVTEASIVEEEPAPTPAPTPDAVTEASVTD